MTQTIAKAVAAGKVEAKKAADEYVEQYGEPLYCGFAWVEVSVARTNTKEAKELIAAGFSKSWKPKTLVLWNPSGHQTQSMEVMSIGADAMVRVLRQAGLNARSCWRPD